MIKGNKSRLIETLIKRRFIYLYLSIICFAGFIICFAGFIIAYAETMRYVSNIGKVLMFLLGSGAAFFLVEFILAPWRNR
jgi:hypothetical protein